MSKLWFEIPGYFNYMETYEMIAHKLPEGSRFIELGCLLGKSTNFLASRLKELNKKFEFHVVDTFEGTAGEHDHMKAFYDIFMENCGHLVEEGWITKVHKMRTDEAVKLFEDEYFDAVMVDADHKYEPVYEDVTNWLPKIKKTGTIFGDDHYMPSVAQGCSKAMSDYFKKNTQYHIMEGKESTWFHDLGGNPERWTKKIP